MCKKHDPDLGDAQNEQCINHESIVDASTTVHELDRVVNSFWDTKFGLHSHLVCYNNFSVEKKKRQLGLKDVSQKL